jgi:hypothetical protein
MERPPDSIVACPQERRARMNIPLLFQDELVTTVSLMRRNGELATRVWRAQPPLGLPALSAALQGWAPAERRYGVVLAPGSMRQWGLLRDHISAARGLCSDEGGRRRVPNSRVLRKRPRFRRYSHRGSEASRGPRARLIDPSLTGGRAAVLAGLRSAFRPLNDARDFDCSGAKSGRSAVLVLTTA